jgi:signal transduction histidine kinase
VKVIVIEDNPDHYEIIEDAFAAMGEINFQVTRADTLSAGESLLFSEHFDICLCDLKLPDSTIEQTVEWVTTLSNPFPIVILTSLNSVDVAQKLLNNGVQDYLSKDELTPQLLIKTCRYAIERFNHQKVIAGYNQDMQAFCASLAHDFNGHISRIKGVSQALKADVDKRSNCTPEELKLFEYLEKSTSQVHSLVSDLQNYLSLGYASLVFEDVCLKTVVDNVVAFLKTGDSKDFQINMPIKLADIKGNHALLQLLFLNLIENAIKFNEDFPIIDISSQANGNFVEVIVQDNGIGFDPIHVQNIFLPFNRLANGKKFGGSGLGLSIAKRIIEHHGGSLEAHSELGIGSKFTLTFKTS